MKYDFNFYSTIQTMVQNLEQLDTHVPAHAQTMRQHLMDFSYATAHMNGANMQHARMMILNYFLQSVSKEAAQQDRLVQELSSDGLTHQMIDPVHYAREIQLIQLLGERINYSKEFSLALFMATQEIADIIEETPQLFSELTTCFPFTSVQEKIDFADRYAEMFHHVVSRKLDIPFDPAIIIKIENKVTANTLALSYIITEKDESPLCVVALNERCFDIDAANFIAIIHHECIHDMLNQVSMAHDITEFSGHPFEGDLILSKLLRNGKRRPLHLIPGAYEADCEEVLCRYNEWRLEDRLARFNPQRQLTHTP